VETSVVGFVEFLGFMGLTTKNPMNSINLMNQGCPTAEASRSCEVLMETEIQIKDRKATKGGL
ncbi:hypothetical protein KGY79_13390, partial [Candidatus Bipolaricaulota bacterium]|nr:hypothetical protein [Candidatus Bipolaricaulota bacterium]